ncbi:MAG: tRNA (adenosine(37)-N6)-threonylcarbamoyltransferase complex transferase subunit TsaD [Clostridia bacterium]|nr:tRNA (adenosine(37)-N6)-threonylcarbamoyltransferase complex transferase subunit TsaD [Clostridia bacterium]
MLILALESSCDETSAAVLDMDTGRRAIRSNLVASQIAVHRLYGGVVPEIASRAHIEAITSLTRDALAEAGCTLFDIGAIGVTASPGLIGALLVGVNFAKSLAYANRIPLVPVNHIRAHVAAALLAHPDLEPPFLALVVSGGHTTLYAVDTYTDYRLLGGTRDDAAGEAFDKVGRVIGLPYPGGAAMDKLAALGDPTAVKLPSPALPGDTLDFSFSGLKTAALNYLNGEAQRGTPIAASPDALTAGRAADLAASYTDTIVRAIVKKTDLALKQTGRKTLVLAGGVAANSHLRAGLTALGAKRGVRLCMPPLSLCGDNAAMVGAQAYYEFLAGVRADTALNASACD